MTPESPEETPYRLPAGLNDFQRGLYRHLIDWKRAHITEVPGVFLHRGRRIPYDAILPDDRVAALPLIYPPVVDELRRHRSVNPFRLHTHFNHMASSQAAAVNLFLPLLLHPRGSKVLVSLRPDFAALATDELDRGYCLEYWGGNFAGDRAGSGPLGDKSSLGGTDADIAIAYRNPAGALCLWLIEHKLTEAEFTPCGGFKSPGRRTRPACDCSRPFVEILDDKATCYHHAVRQREYWNITERHRELFVGHAQHVQCPFQGGLNQLWRNQLLGLAIEQDESQPFEQSHFSVLKHPDNPHLDPSLGAYRDLIGDSPKFSVLTSADVLRAAEALGDDLLTDWVRWYRALYRV